MKTQKDWLLHATNKQWSLIWLLLLLLGSVPRLQAQETPKDLFFSTKQTGTRQMPLDIKVKQSRNVTINWALLDRIATGQENSAVLRLFPGMEFYADFSARELRDTDRYSLFGTVRDMPWSSIIVTREHDAVAMTLQTTGGLNIELRNVGGGVFAVTSLDNNKFAECGGAIPINPAPVVPRGNIGIQATTQFDVILYYTPASRNAAGGTNQIVAVCQQAVDVANTSYVNSGLDVHCNLLNAAEVAYTEVTNNSNLNLDRLAGTSDGFMDNVHAERNLFGADLVGLICEATDACGVAYLAPSNAANGFFLVDRECAVGNLSLAHEMGHNMGCGHGGGDGGGISSYSNGLRFTANGNQYRTVMAYPPGTRIPYFTSPLITYLGVTIGNASTADNARTIREWIGSVAAFRVRPYFVDKVIGQDFFPGTYLAPFRTVARALAAADNTVLTPIYIRAGNFNERPRTTKKVSYRNWGNVGQSSIGRP